MKRNKIILSSLLLAAAGMASCDDEKQLTLDAPEVKLMESIVLEVSDVLPLPVGMDSTIVYTCSPEDAVDLTVVFSSSDESVATVSQDGTIHAIKPGEATITAQNPFGFDIYETSASVQVHVIPELIPVERIEIANTTQASEDGKIFVTDELQFEATVYPEDATYKRLVWSSADESIATVDENRLVVCHKEGEAKIYATSTDRSGIRGEFTFHINKFVTATNVSIKPLDGPVCLTLGAFPLEVTYEPAGATIGSVEWSTDDESVATVHRGVVSPRGFGSCNITAKCIENDLTVSVNVTVDPGWYIWDASNQWSWWETANEDAPDTRGDRTWHVEMKDPNGGKWGRNIRIKDISHQNPIIMRLKSYPVLAVRMTRLNGGVSKLDDAVANGFDAKRAKELNAGNGIDLGDGTQLLIYNLGANYEGVDEVGFRVFQFKITDIPNGNIDPLNAFYDVHWIRTFKSEDEAKTFAADQVAAGE